MVPVLQDLYAPSLYFWVRGARGPWQQEVSTKLTPSHVFYKFYQVKTATYVSNYRLHSRICWVCKVTKASVWYWFCKVFVCRHFVLWGPLSMGPMAAWNLGKVLPGQYCCICIQPVFTFTQMALILSFDLVLKVFQASTEFSMPFRHRPSNTLSFSFCGLCFSALLCRFTKESYWLCGYISGIYD